MNRILFLVAFSFISISVVFSQSKVMKGRVVDVESGNGLPFVNILFNDSQQGTISNIDGYFEFVIPSDLNTLRFSYVGYKEKTLMLEGELLQKMLKISMETQVEELEEVKVLPGENPAHRIVQNLVRNRAKNDPENLKSFSYLGYHKMKFNLNFQELLAKIPVEERNNPELEWLKDHDLLFMESLSERKFLRPDHSKEKVISSRISGYKNPEMALLSSQLQSFSFYKDFVELSETRYLSPVSPGSHQKYLFLLEDTLYNAQKDTVFVISFRPRKGKNFKGLKGTIYVNSRGYALQNVIAGPAQKQRGLNLSVQQKYELVDGVHWFPVQLNTKIQMDGLVLNGPLKDVAIVGDGKSYLMNVLINPPLNRKDFDEVEVEVAPEAYEKGEEVLSGYRVRPLTKQELETYHKIDSLGAANHLDRKLDAIMSLMWGKMPLGAVDLDLKRLIGFDGHQGFRLGLGLTTNDKLLKWAEVGGYTAYGFRDKEWKYGGHLKLHPFSDKNNYLLGSYANDLRETGGSWFLDDKAVQSSESFRPFLLKEFDQEEVYRLGLGTVLFPSLRVEGYWEHSQRKSLDDYRFLENAAEINQYKFSEAGLMFRFAYNEKFMKTQKHKISLGTKYPMLWLNIARGLSVLDGEYEYTRLEMKAKGSCVCRGLGKSYVTLMGGWIDEDLPLTALFNNRPGFNKSEPIAVDNNFNTMRINEFASDRYVALFFKQDFGSLLFKTPYFQPELALVHHMGWGDLSHPESHLNSDVKIMNKGFFESGVQVNSILKGLFNIGVGAYYRYGPFAFDRFSNNLAVKMTLSYSL
jgi:hypothetical protein